MGNVKIRRGTKAPTAVSRVDVSGRATYRTRATPRTTTPLAAAGEKKGSRRKATSAPVSTATGRRGARGPRGGGGGGATSSRRRSRDPRGRLPSRSKRRRSAPAFLGSCRPCAKPRSSRGGERGARRRRNRAAPCAGVWSCSLEIMLRFSLFARHRKRESRAKQAVSPPCAFARKPKSRRASGVRGTRAWRVGGTPLTRASLRDRRYEARREVARSV